MTAGGAVPHAHPSHRPVLWTQAVDALRVLAEGRYLDGTYGRGGHARGVLDRLGPAGRLLVMDKDPVAIANAQALAAQDARVAVRHGSFADLAAWDETTAGLDGVLFDLGVSSPQLDEAGRGFSFRLDGPLDMRMDNASGESAAQWLARADEREIAHVLWTFGEEKLSRKIARAIKALGVGRFDLIYTAGAQPISARLRAVELYGTKVIPMVRDILGG